MRKLTLKEGKGLAKDGSENGRCETQTWVGVTLIPCFLHGALSFNTVAVLRLEARSQDSSPLFLPLLTQYMVGERRDGFMDG